MSKPWTPDGASSRALLIGVSDYKSPGLEQIPAVRNNLDALKDALSGERGLLPPDHIRVLGANGTPVDRGAIGRELSSARREAEDLLLVYYAGHGLLDNNGLLHLAVTGTDPDPDKSTGFTALPFQLLKRELAQSRAKARVLVLDCCFSGRAVAAMSPQHTLLAGQLDLNGTYTLTSTTATAPSHAPPGAHHTAFTEALLSALTQPEAHTLDDIYQHIDQKLNSTGLPRPQARSVNAASNLVLTRGPVKTKPPTTHTPTPTHPPGPPEVRFRAKVSWRKRLPNPLLMFCLPLFLLLLFGASIGAGFTFKGAVLLLMSLPVLLAMRVSTRNVRAKYASLSIDGTSLSVDKPGWPSFRIPWEHVSHLGVLDNYVFSTKNHGVLKAEKVLVVRLQQSSPRIKGTWFAPAKGNEVPHSLNRIRYVGFPIQDFNADPTQLRQAVERLSDRPYRSDLELGELDPRLRTTVPWM